MQPKGASGKVHSLYLFHGHQATVAGASRLDFQFCVIHSGAFTWRGERDEEEQPSV